MRRDEVLQHRQTFAEVRGDRRFDDLARGLGHQTAHTRQLTNLLLRTTRTGVGHDVNRVHGAVLVGLLHVVEHFIRHALGHGRPQLNDLVVAFTVGDRTVEVLLLDVDDLLLGLGHHGILRIRNDHVVEAYGEARLGSVTKAKILDAIEGVHGDLKPKVQVEVVDELSNALLLQQTIDVRHAFRQRIVQNRAADGRRDELLVQHDHFGVV